MQSEHDMADSKLPGAKAELRAADEKPTQVAYELAGLAQPHLIS